MTTSTLIKKLSIATAGAVFFTLGAMGAAQAQVTISEDAGQTLSTAQEIPSGSLTLDSISGTISSPQEADLYRIFINDPGLFSATTVGGASLNTQLFLFNSDGNGVYGSDDDSPATVQSTLFSGSQFSPTQPGFYFLGISAFNNDPESAAGEIFSETTIPRFPNLFVIPQGPTGPGGGLPLTNFNGDGSESEFGPYEISLTGVQAVPEPSSVFGLLTFGAFGARAMLKRFRGKYKN